MPGIYEQEPRPLLSLPGPAARRGHPLNLARGVAIYGPVLARSLTRWTLLVALLAAPAPLRAQDLTEARRVEIAERLQKATVVIQTGGAVGSGFVVAPDRLVLTNAHVVGRSQRVRVTYHDGSEHVGIVLAVDPAHDLAAVEVRTGTRAETLPLGDSDEVKIGQSVLAFGSPFGLEGTLTQGIVSARRDMPLQRTLVRGIIQTDAPINSGNSGGPLVNSAGHVIGVNTFIFRGGQGLSFAVPINLAKAFLSELREALGAMKREAEARPEPQPRRRPGWLGVFGEDFAFGAVQGVLVRRVVRTGPAARAGLRGSEDPPPAAYEHLGRSWPGHIITAMDGKPVHSMRELAERVSRAAVGEKVTLDVLVGPGLGRHKLKMQVGELPDVLAVP